MSPFVSRLEIAEWVEAHPDDMNAWHVSRENAVVLLGRVDVARLLATREFFGAPLGSGYVCASPTVDDAGNLTSTFAIFAFGRCAIARALGDYVQRVVLGGE